MDRVAAVGVTLLLLTAFSVTGLSGAPGPALPTSPVEHRAVERFLAEIDKPPVAYQARRRLEASSTKLNESAWMEVATEYEPAAGFQYSIVAQGGSERIAKRVLRKVLEAEKEHSVLDEWRKGNLSHANYLFDFGGHGGATRGSFRALRSSPPSRAILFVSKDACRSRRQSGCAG
jgi:hypothetical protein